MGFLSVEDFAGEVVGGDGRLFGVWGGVKGGGGSGSGGLGFLLEGGDVELGVELGRVLGEGLGVAGEGSC